MNERERCLNLIQKVREVATGDQVAYVARSRVGRLLLNTRKLVGQMANIDVPDRPIKLNVPSSASTSLKDLVEVSNRINDSARVLVQPSEPLDERWKSGWTELLAELDQLELHLRKFS